MIIGPSGSGKTALFQYLYSKEFRQTVSSLEENSTTDEDTNIRMPAKRECKVSSIDIPGHFNFRARIQETVENARAVILMVDSKDRTKLPEAAEMLYDILNNITVLENKVPIMVVCNKQDIQFARRATQIEHEFERDIEELRRVRKATMDDQDTAKE